MPVMEPNLDAATLKAWARVIDGGPFSSLCWGERIAFDNPECLTLLGALSAWTDRVRLVTTVVVPQLPRSTSTSTSKTSCSTSRASRGRGPASANPHLATSFAEIGTDEIHPPLSG